MTRPATKRPLRLRDLPGFEEAAKHARQAELRVTQTTITTAGNFIAPPSIKRVTLKLLLPLAFGIEAQRWYERGERHDRRLKGDLADIIPMARWRERRDFLEAEARRVGFDERDPATWTRDKCPFWVKQALKMAESEVPS